MLVLPLITIVMGISIGSLYIADATSEHARPATWTQRIGKSINYLPWCTPLGAVPTGQHYLDGSCFRAE